MITRVQSERERGLSVVSNGDGMCRVMLTHQFLAMMSLRRNGFGGNDPDSTKQPPADKTRDRERSRDEGSPNDLRRNEKARQHVGSVYTLAFGREGGGLLQRSDMILF